MANKAKKQHLDPTMPVYQVKITLRDVKPLIWRRVQMDDCCLDELHDIIQICMGWEDEHMYAFVIEGEQYGDLENGADFEYDVQSVRLSDLIKRGRTRFRYDYGFGRSWRHSIEIERTLPAEERVFYPRCVKGERACPPEGCGGPHGYPSFLDKIQDPDHAEHEHALEWVGGEFDPEEVNLDETNKELCHLRRFLGYCKGKRMAVAADAPYDRIRALFGLTTDDPLPRLDKQNQRKFLAYLKANLAFPFKADCPAASVEGSGTSEAVTVLGFAERPIDSTDGIMCEVRKGKSAFQVPLSNIHVIDDVYNFQLVEDYTCWLWEGDECDEDEEPDDEQTGGNVIPIPEEFMEILNLQREKVITKVGENPDPGDKPFFDALPLEHVEHMIVQAMRRVGVAPAIVNAFEKTDLIVTLANQHRLKGTELDKRRAREESNTKHGKSEGLQFPVGTIAYYGPDDKTTTKIVAGIINEEGAEPIIQRWVATDVTTNPKVRKEIGRFFKTYGVNWVNMSNGNMGCLHEEGEDFPMGGDCPFCPWWKGKQGSGTRAE
jgi:hypothetical protein